MGREGSRLSSRIDNSRVQSREVSQHQSRSQSEQYIRGSAVPQTPIRSLTALYKPTFSKYPSFPSISPNMKQTSNFDLSREIRLTKWFQQSKTTVFSALGKLHTTQSFQRKRSH